MAGVNGSVTVPGCCGRRAGHGRGGCRRAAVAGAAGQQGQRGEGCEGAFSKVEYSKPASHSVR